MPVIWGLYTLLQKVVSINSHSVVSEVNKLTYISAFKLTSPWDPNFFGIPLGAVPSKLMSFDKFFTVGSLILLVPILTGFFQFIQSKMMLTSAPKQAMVEKGGVKKKDDFASVFQSQSLYIFPVMIGFFSFGFPIGLSLYWNTFTVFGIIQQYLISGWGGLKDFKFLKIK